MMKKRMNTAALLLCLALALPGSGAAAAGSDNKLETLQVLGILDGSGSTAAQVTRAQFAQMLVAASVYRDTAEGYGSSLFKDLRGDHWASGSVRIAVEQGWMSGYMDGSFRPDQAVTLEEGCAALLQLLGYDASALTGAYPAAQLAKAGSIGLLDGVSARQGAKLTGQDCVDLFYQLLTTQTAAGTVYGTAIGCTVTDGQVDYSALVAAGLKGPYTAEADGVLELPFPLDQNAVLFCGGAASTLRAVKQYDVYYYNEAVRTVWVYQDRVIGALTGVSPNRIAPESVTVAGQSYQLENRAAVQTLSGLEEDATVTLLLGMNGQVADILPGVHGELDSDAYLAAVNTGTKGPYVADSHTLELPFDGASAAVYRNGAPSALSSVQPYDVYYYNTALQTVWLYSNSVTGTLTAVSPNQAAPTAVTVAGVTYQIGASEAARQLSAQGSFREGDLITLLLGMNGEVVRVLDAQESEVLAYGLVVSSARAASTPSTASSAAASAQTVTQIACTDGVVRTFYHDGAALSAGRLAAVSVTQSGAAVKGLPVKTLEGTVSKDGTSFAGYDFAAGVQILDTDENGGYVRIYPARLAGARLSGDDVRYYTLDANGDIDRMVLRTVTGDTRPYVYVSGIADSSADMGMNISVSYTYLLDGQTQSLHSSAKYAVQTGGAVMLYEKGSLKSIRQLTPVALDSVSALSAMGEERAYKLAENVQVLLRDSTDGQSYYLTSLSQVNGEDYRLTGWYDDLGYSAGGRIRLIVAAPR